MQVNNTMPGSGADTEALQGLPDETVTKIIEGVAGMLMQSKLMQWVQSQMPEDWTPGEAEDDEIPPEHADLPSEAAEDTTFQPEGDGVDGGMGDGMESPADVGAATSGYPDDEASPDEIGDMDDEDKERYAAHDSAGRKGFLQAWRKHNRHNKAMYSAAGGNSMSRTGQTESYSRLKVENDNLQQRVDQLEARDRHRDRYSRLATLNRTHEFKLDTEFLDVKDVPQEQFDRHCQRIKENYSRRAVPMGEFTPKLPVDGPEKIDGQDEQEKKVDRYSRRALEIANDELKIKPRVGMTWDEAFARAVKEIDGATVATA